MCIKCAVVEDHKAVLNPLPLSEVYFIMKNGNINVKWEYSSNVFYQYFYVTTCCLLLS